jgi:hypothetical protein
MRDRKKNQELRDTLEVAGELQYHARIEFHAKGVGLVR